MSLTILIAVRATVWVEHNRRESQTKEELMVSNDVMRLEVKRLRDTLNGAADEVFSLENRRQQLAMSMKERKAEIQVMTRLFFTVLSTTVSKCALRNVLVTGQDGGTGTEYVWGLQTQTLVSFLSTTGGLRNVCLFTPFDVAVLADGYGSRYLRLGVENGILGLTNLVGR